jgi:hypothetical protein
MAALFVTTTPAAMFGAILRCVSVALMFFWVASFFIARLMVFVDSFQATHAILRGEEWLLQQCMVPEFFARMRQHSDLCITVQRNADRGPVLSALNAVAGTAHLCGSRSCLETVIDFRSNRWPFLLWIGLALLLGNMLFGLLKRFLKISHATNGVYKERRLFLVSFIV